MRTADGRTLAFRVVGEPGGHPVVVLHGTPGSRSGIQLNAPLLYRNRIQVIFYDRPGYGESDRDERRYVASAADNIESIVNQLAIDRFAVVGWSGGGPHALATAALLPDRVTHAAVLASYAPYDAPDLDWFEGMDPARAKLFPRNEDDRSRCMEHVRLCAERARRDPQWLVDEFRTGAEDADLATLNRLGIRRQLGEGYAEAVRAGPYGWIDDVFALRSAWGFRCDDITVPVRIWHGADDTVVPPTHAQWLAHHIRHATLAIDPNAGHFGAVDLLSDAVLWSLA